jgi:hypothetical protein
VACLVRVGAEVYDRAGAQLGRDELVLSARQLERGLARACRGEQAQPATPASNAPGELFAPMPERIEATLALHTLLAVVRKSKLLYGVLYEVIDKPSLWSVITHFGVRVSTLDHFDQARPAAPFTLGSGAGAVEVPAWEAPLELRLNGAPALRSIVTVVDPVSPLILCTGVVALRAFRPSDPKVTFTLRLLAARRGSVP